MIIVIISNIIVIGEFLLSLSPTTNVSKLHVHMEGFCQLLE